MHIQAIAPIIMKLSTLTLIGSVSLLGTLLMFDMSEGGTVHRIERENGSE